MKYLLILLFTAVSLLAQSQNSGSIKGIVSNASNSQPLDLVVLQLADSNTTITQLTDDKGQYAFTNIKPGSYNLTLRIFGMAPIYYGPLAVKANEEIVFSPMLDVNIKVTHCPVSIDEPYRLNDNPSSTTYSTDDIRRLAVPR